MKQKLKDIISVIFERSNLYIWMLVIPFGIVIFTFQSILVTAVCSMFVFGVMLISQRLLDLYESLLDIHKTMVTTLNAIAWLQDLLQKDVNQRIFQDRNN